MTANASTVSDFKVGLITFFGIGLLVAGIVLAGGESGLLFNDKSLIHAHMKDVGGLKKGAPVTMGGLNIGKVSDIVFNEDGPLPTLQVEIQVSSKYRHYIKTDSVPAVRTQGMMGDRYVDISMGSPNTDVLREDEFLVGKPVTELEETLRKATDVLAETEKLILAINQKEGSVGEFFYDKTFYTKITLVSDEMHKLLRDLNVLIEDFKEDPKKYVNVSIF